jgi:hypothetical protein
MKNPMKSVECRRRYPCVVMSQISALRSRRLGTGTRTSRASNKLTETYLQFYPLAICIGFPPIDLLTLILTIAIVSLGIHALVSAIPTWIIVQWLIFHAVCIVLWGLRTLGCQQSAYYRKFRILGMLNILFGKVDQWL